MPCPDRRPFYNPPASGEGILKTANDGQGDSIKLTWVRAYPDSVGFQVAYTIYFSSNQDHVFEEGAKYLVIDPVQTTVRVLGFTPGDTYYFGVRATEYETSIMNPSLLPDSGDSKVLPEGMLLSPLTTVSTSIPITDLDQFPNFGAIIVGVELIGYQNKDLLTSSLTGLTRGLYGTDIRFHDLDGYDGLEQHADPLVHYWKGFEEGNLQVSAEVSTFAYPFYAYTNADGYQNDVDILTTDLTAVEDEQTDFPAYDLSGYHRDHPADILAGNCIGSYIGGEQYCADGYGGVGRQLRGLPIQDVNDQREELLLQTDGEPVILMKKNWTGIRCYCFLPETEYPEERCPSCFVPETLIKTELGWRQIVDVKVGEKVLADDGNYRTVTKVFENDYSGQLQAITSSVNGRPIYATPEHPFLVLRGTHNPMHGCSPRRCHTYIKNGDGLVNNYGGIAPKLTKYGKWQAQVTIKNEGKLHIGMFETKEEALRAIEEYNKWQEIEPAHVLEWDDAKNIKKNDWLVSRWYDGIEDKEFIEIPQQFGKNTKLGINRNGVDKFILDEEFMWIVGIYLAEGCCKEREVVFSLHCNEIEYQNRIVNYFNKLKYGTRIKFRKNSKGVAVSVNSTTLANWFPEMFGTYCYNKQIPEEFMRLPENKLRALLDGIWCGDGSKRENEIGQTSEILALQMVEILHRIGEQPLVRTSQAKKLTPKGNKRKLCYHVNWAENTKVRNNRRGRWNLQDQILAQVQKIEQIEYSGKVYNLEVEEDHTYVVQGVVVHNCNGGGFVMAWQQYYSPRRSDGRILVRFDPTEDDLLMQDGGLESSFPANAWTLSTPAVKDRDFIIRFKSNADFFITGMEPGTEEFRYEILSVTRNKIFNNQTGRQQMKLQRVRKTDPIATVAVNKSIGTMPTLISTTIGSGPGILPHIHQIMINENIISPAQITGITTIGANHSHTIRNGVFESTDADPSDPLHKFLDTELGHTHTLIF